MGNQTPNVSTILFSLGCAIVGFFVSPPLAVVFGAAAGAMTVGPWLAARGRAEAAREAAHQAQADARRERSRYHLAASVENDGLWEWHFNSSQAWFSERWKSVLGYGGDAIGEHLEHWLGRVHPEDQQRVRDELQWLSDGRTREIDIVHAVRCADGEFVTVRVRARADDVGGRGTRAAGWLSVVDAPATVVDEVPQKDARVRFAEELNDALERAGDAAVAVIMGDVDRARALQDALGADLADGVLREIGERIGAALPAGTTLTRFGGDKYGVIVPWVRDPTEAGAVAERIEAAVARPFHVGQRKMHVRISLGLARTTEVPEGPRALIRAAEQALARGKRAGGGRIIVFEPRMRERVIVDLGLEEDLRRAVEREELEVFYQPIVAFDSGRLRGMEALVRWRTPDGRLVPPDNFVPLAEQTGLIVPIGLAVLRESCSRLAAWIARGWLDPDVTMSVNLAAAQLTDEFVANLGEVITNTGLPTANVRLEVTEGAAMGDPEHAVELMERMRNLGVKLALDDFGTGYSSLGWLQRFPVNTLKLDKRFVMGIAKNSGDMAICRSVISMAQAFGLDVVAEGIETETHRAQMAALGATHGQGYYYSRALSQGETELLLTRAPHARDGWWEGLSEAIEMSSWARIA